MRIVANAAVPQREEKLFQRLRRRVAGDVTRHRVERGCMTIVELSQRGAVADPAEEINVRHIGFVEVYPETMNWIIKNFLRGLVIVVPFAITVYVVYIAFIRLDSLLAFRFPGVGLAVIVVTIILIGAVASNFLVRKFLELTELLFTRAPIVRIIYAAVRDLLEAFVGDQKRFDKPVVVQITDDFMTLGFVTQEDLGFLAMPGNVAVYLPFSYSMAGTLIVVPAGRVRRLETNSAAVMALVVSGGVSRG